MIINYCISFSVLNEYFYILISLFLSLLISVLLYSIVAFITYKQYDLDKLSSFECGFHPFEDTREKFNIRFYLVSILFIIFDLEITFLFPWAINLQYLNLLGYWSMFLFLVILTIGFIYEWKKGALDWE